MNPGKRTLSTPTRPASKREAHFETPKNIRQKIRSLLSSSGLDVQDQLGTPLRNTRTAGQVTSSIEVNENRNNEEIPTNQEVKFMISKPADNINSLNFLRTGTELQESELLLYSLLNVNFPSAHFKARYFEKYKTISTVIENVYHVKYDCAGISNYLHRANNNITRDLGKIKGLLRWKYYRMQISRVTENHKSTLERLLSLKEVASTSVNMLRDQIEVECKQLNKSAQEKTSYSEVTKTFKTSLIETINIEEFHLWKVSFNGAKCTGHLYYFGGASKGYCQVELVINCEGQWRVILEGKKRGDISLEWADLSPTINTEADMKKIMLTLQSVKVCSGCPVDKYHTVLPVDESLPIYCTRSGEPAAFVEVLPSQYHKKVIRSTYCMVFVPHDEVLLSSDTCAARKTTEHYLRTLKSRAQCEAPKDKSNYTRFDYLSKQELLQMHRERTSEMRYLQEKIKRLEKYREKMTEVGGKTDTDFRALFGKLHKGMAAKKEKLKNAKCYWEGCNKTDRFSDVENLYVHVKTTHIDSTDTDIAPINRVYICKWEHCKKTFGKKKLLYNHIREHTGSLNDQFFEVLLTDQAKALNVPSRRMRWHPLVIKWCLRLYSKSHSAYEDLRESGFLKLPSGRTLSDYKNFASPKSGWQTTSLQNMKESFQKSKIGKHGKLGGLFFDEVKIKEGLVFNPSTFELIGFTDLDDDDIPYGSEVTENDVKLEKKISTHVLQFFYKSLFANFEFPCAFFLTRGVTATKLNRVFWQGISLLHGFGFSIMLTCCDGAPENRSFMNMNGINRTKSKCNNPFSKMPLFFISDPPHLMKKLRNNIFNSGFKDKNARFTRRLRKNGKDILWDHIYSVYQRDKKRRLFATDLRSSHVHLNNLSKMRVKLAVNTLSAKVRQDMATYENNVTASTQEYIKNCETFWNVFNDNKQLDSHNDIRMTSLTEVLNYYKNWKTELQQLYKTKTEISSHFITWQTMFDLEVSIDGLKELLMYIQSVEFKNSYGQLYIIPKRLNQDIVESFFSSQRQMCGGSTNMTAFTYGYNVNGLISYRQSRLLRNKQTNVYEVEECFHLAQASELLPKRTGQSHNIDVTWTVQL